MNPENFLIAWLLTLAFELPILFLILGSKPPWRQILWAGLTASSMTLPWLWFVFDYWWSHSQLLVFGESLVVILEAALLTSWLRIRWQRCFLAAFSANLTSVLLGHLVLGG